MKNTKCKYADNLKMNGSTYALRRKVINCIYEAKTLVPSLPRVDVRITENAGSVLGVGRMNGCFIWIMENTVQNYSDLQLRHVVFHELLHAVKGVDHDENCKLMSACIKPTTRQEQDEAFMKHF